MIVKLFLGLLILALLWFIAQKLKKIQTPKRPQPPLEDQTSTGVLRCKHCGIYVPKPEVIWHDKDSFCSQQHRDMNK